MPGASSVMPGVSPVMSSDRRESRYPFRLCHQPFLATLPQSASNRVALVFGNIAGNKKWRSSKLDAIFLFICGERGSRTYGIIENHKISIRCKLSVYKIVKFIETHRVHFDI